MKSTARLFGHPLHPILIPYPLALLSSATAFDLAGRFAGRTSWSRTARDLVNVGLGSAVAAAVPGIVDYFGSTRSGSRPRRDATWHALLNASALTCFWLARERRRADGRLPTSGIALALAGTGLLSVGGWFGGELVYRQQVGVEGGPFGESGPDEPLAGLPGDTDGAALDAPVDVVQVTGVVVATTDDVVDTPQDEERMS